jgi:ATP-dependent Clp protease ATP-binding subunit ClpC
MSMWEPFTEPARRSIVAAQEAAERLGSQSIDPDHLFMGIVAVGHSLGAEVLAAFDVTSERVDDAANRVLSRGRQRQNEEMIFTTGAKRMIERAFEEARDLHHEYIGAEHLTLAWLAEFAAKSALSRALGIDFAAIRRKLLEKASTAPVLHRAAPLSLDTCFRSVTRGKGGETESSAYWEALNRAAGEHDIGAVLLYGFLIAKSTGLSSSETAKRIIDAAT